MTRTWNQRVDPIQRRVRSARLRHLTMLAFRVLRRLYTPYEVAQILDSGSGLRDAFPTAWFLFAHPGYATGFHAAAHVAHANSLVSQIRPGKLFPIPAKRLLMVATLAGLLAYTGSVIPHALTQGKSATSTRVNPASRPGFCCVSAYRSTS
jgi:hypothetical protein